MLAGMAVDAATLLDQVNQAISDLLTSGVASMADGGQSFTMNDLGKLQDLRRNLTAEVAASNGGMFRLGVPLRQQRSNPIRRL